jgi:CubicO group peptidase (beta-lactamase class C family)
MHAIKLALLTLLVAAVALADPGEDRANAWVKAFNAGPEAMEAFAVANYTDEARARRTPAERRGLYDNLHAAHGTLSVMGVRIDGDTVNLTAKPERGDPLQLRFKIEAAEPHRIAGLGIEVGGGPGDGPRANLPPLNLPKNAHAANYDQQLNTALDAYLRKLAADDAFSGTVLVAKNGEAVFDKAYGLASRRFSVPNKTSTRFNVGSITKDFTKTAIAQLAQAGKLKMTDTIATHLPDYPNKDVAGKITIQQLVDHRSGLGDIFTRRFFEVAKNGFSTPRDFIAFFASDPLQFEPGTQQKYSNYGYVVLGAIVEAVSGEGYFDYIQQHVFTPLGMSGSGFLDLELPIPDIAIGHTKQRPTNREPYAEWHENTAFRYNPRGIPAGGSYSTTRDLLLFDRAMRAGKLLNPEWSRWYHHGDPNGPAVYAGGSPGVNAVVASDATWTVIVLGNIDPPLPEALGELIYKALAP